MTYDKFINEIVFFFNSPKKKYKVGEKNVITMINYKSNPYDSVFMAYVMDEGVPKVSLCMEVFKLYRFLYNNPSINTYISIEDILSYIDYTVSDYNNYVYSQNKDSKVIEECGESLNYIKESYSTSYDEFKNAINSILNSAENPPCYIVNDLLFIEYDGEVRCKSLKSSFNSFYVAYGIFDLTPLLLSMSIYIYTITDYDIMKYVSEYLDMLNEEVGDVSCLN